jgi:uncharacterized membrane protein YkoI
MKKLSLSILVCLISLISFSQTWQYSVSGDDLGLRDKLGEGSQNVSIHFKSDFENISFSKKMKTTDDDWLMYHLKKDFKKSFKPTKFMTYLFKVTCKLDNAELFTFDYAYNSLKMDQRAMIKFDNLPSEIQARMIGKFLDGELYRNEDGINYYVQVQLQDESKTIVEYTYTISDTGVITETEIQR